MSFEAVPFLPAPAKPDELHALVLLVRRALSHYRAALAVFVVGMIGAVALVKLYPRLYRSEAVLVYRNPLSAAALGSEATESARSLGPRLKESVNSRVRLEQLAQELHLYPHLNDAEALAEFRKRLAFHSSGDVFELSYDSNSPELAQAALSRLAADLVEENTKSQREQASLTRDFLESERQHSELELRHLEEATADFKVRHPEVAMAGPAGSATASAGRGARSAVRPTADVDRHRPDREADAAYVFLQKQAQVLTERLSVQQAARVAKRNDANAAVLAAQKELAEKLTQYTDQHPDVVSVKRRLAVAQANLDRAIDEVEAGAESAIQERSAIQEKAAEAMQAAVPRRARTTVPSAPDEGVLLSSPDPAAVDAEWMRLSRSLSEQRERQQQIEDRLFTAEMLANAARAHISVSERPYLPKHAQPPGRTILLAAGSATATALALLLALFLALIDDRIIDGTEISKRAQVRMVEAVSGPLVWSTAPASPSSSAAESLNRLLAPPTSAAAADFRLLRWRLTHFGNPTIVAVTSPNRDQGSTTCAANLAMAMAEQGGARVLLVGLNSRAEEPARMLEVTGAAALQKRLTHNDRKALVPIDDKNGAPTFVQIGELVRRGPGETIDGVALASAIRSLREESYDYIVIDAPAVLGSSETNLIGEAADAILVTCRIRNTHTQEVLRSLEQLAPLPVLGVVMLDA